MLKDGEDELKFRNSFGLFFAIGFISEGYRGAVIVNNSPVGDGRMSCIASDVT